MSSDIEEEEEDSEEEVGTDRPRKRSKYNPFIEFEAEVENEDEDVLEDEEDEIEEQAKFIADVEDTSLPAHEANNDRRHRELDRQRAAEMGAQAEQVAADFKKRYAKSRAQQADTLVVPRSLLGADVNDPGIWRVKCKEGKERDILYQLSARIENPRAGVRILSAFERGGVMKGAIYVEAEQQSDVTRAVDGISNVYPRSGMMLVPVKERDALLRVKKDKELDQGAYVRIKRGKYAGDLAQVEDIEENGLEVLVRIVPRLDYGLNEDLNAPVVDGPASKRKRIGLSNVRRPPQRLFSEVEARKVHSKHLQMNAPTNKKHWSYLGENYSNGFLMKELKLQLLQTQDVNPTLEEVTKFASANTDEGGTESLDLSALAVANKDSSAHGNYATGEMVEVNEGEQEGAIGRVTTVRQDIVTLQVTEGPLKGQHLDSPAKSLRKRFEEGDHVQVIGGSHYKDEVGMIVKIVKDKVTFVTDQTLDERTVFSKDLRKAQNSGGVKIEGQYDLHDLVQLDPSTVGCVIKVDRQSLRILDQNGSIRIVQPSQISNKVERKRHAVAVDKNGSEIRVEDKVREVGGDSREGSIIHIHHSFLFLHNRDIVENSGVYVVRTGNVATMVARGGRPGGSSAMDLTKMNPSMQRNGANSDMAPPKTFGRDKALGQTVTIRRGPHKGLVGIVKDTTDDTARVELHTKSKIITISKDLLGFRDAHTGQTKTYAELISFRGGRGAPRDSGYSSHGSTPSARGRPEPYGARSEYGSLPSRIPATIDGHRTPSRPFDDHSNISDGRTPAWGRTPSWARAPLEDLNGAASLAAAGGKTPLSGGKTPAPSHVYGGDTGYSSAADAFAAGSKTPGYSMGSSSSYGGPGGDPFSAGGMTPGPAWGKSESESLTASALAAAAAPTPGPTTDWYGSGGRETDHPTPGAGLGGLNAPTPAFSPQTPGVWGGAIDAPTPGGKVVATPAGSGSMPETPAGWGGEDEGPRYATPSP